MSLNHPKLFDENFAKQRIYFTKKYFAGSLSGYGFTNYLYPAIKNMRKIYIIKGTPGSGKSTLMKKIATAAELTGADVERIYCSSDPFSLDGIVIPSRSFAMVDGTAPHVIEPSYPLAKEVILNLGDYLSLDKVEAQREKIINESDAKKSLFETARELLTGAMSLETVKYELYGKCVDNKKIYEYAQKIVSKEQKYNQEGIGVKRSLFAFGKDGFSCIFPFENVKRLYVFEEGIAPFVLEELKKQSEKYIIPFVYSPSPVNPDMVASIYFPLTERFFVDKRFFVSDAIPIKKETVRASRLDIFEEIKKREEKQKFFSKTLKIIYLEAQSYINEAMKHHLALEKIYSSALDIKGIDCLTDSIIVSLFGNQ